MKKVLVVDDTKSIRLLLTKCLEIEGYKVQSADNGREGLEMLCGNRFDLVFLDIKLPEISGTEVLRQIRARGVATPVIIITAYPTVKNAVECTQLGAITYLQKPFTSDRLRAVLAQFDLDGQDAKQEPDKSAAIRALLGQNEFAKALPLLKSALAESPMEPEIYRLLSRTYAGLGDEAAAQKFLHAGRAFES